MFSRVDYLIDSRKLKLQVSPPTESEERCKPKIPPPRALSGSIDPSTPKEL